MWENEYLIDYTKLFFWPASRRRKFCLFQNFPNLVFVPKTPNPSFIGFYSRLYWLYRIITLFSAPGPPGEETKLWEKTFFFFAFLWQKPLTEGENMLQWKFMSLLWRTELELRLFFLIGISGAVTRGSNINVERDLSEKFKKSQKSISVTRGSNINVERDLS